MAIILPQGLVKILSEQVEQAPLPQPKPGKAVLPLRPDRYRAPRTPEWIRETNPRRPHWMARRPPRVTPSGVPAVRVPSRVPKPVVPEIPTASPKVPSWRALFPETALGWGAVIAEIITATVLEPLAQNPDNWRRTITADGPLENPCHPLTQAERERWLIEKYTRDLKDYPHPDDPQIPKADPTTPPRVEPPFVPVSEAEAGKIFENLFPKNHVREVEVLPSKIEIEIWERLQLLTDEALSPYLQATNPVERNIARQLMEERELTAKMQEAQQEARDKQNGVKRQRPKIIDAHPETAAPPATGQPATGPHQVESNSKIPPTPLAQKPPVQEASSQPADDPTKGGIYPVIKREHVGSDPQPDPDGDFRAAIDFRQHTPWFSASSGYFFPTPLFQGGSFHLVVNKKSGKFSLVAEISANDESIARMEKRGEAIFIHQAGRVLIKIREGERIELGQGRWIQLHPPTQPKDLERMDHPPMNAEARRKRFEGTGLEPEAVSPKFNPLATLITVVDEAVSIRANYDFKGKTTEVHKQDWKLFNLKIRALITFMNYEVSGQRLDPAWLNGAEALLREKGFPRNSEQLPISYFPIEIRTISAERKAANLAQARGAMNGHRGQAQTSINVAELPEPSEGMSRYLGPFLSLRGVGRLLTEQDLESVTAGIANMETPNDKGVVSDPGATFDLAYNRYNQADPQATKVLPAINNAYREQVEKEIEQRVEIRSHLPGIYWLRGGNFGASHRTQGRIYFSLKTLSAEQAGYFFSRLIGIHERLKSRQMGIEFKMVANKENFSRADSALIYFNSRHQEAVYAEVLQLYEECASYFKPVIPHFTAQLHDSNGQALTGISFGQDPEVSESSFGEKRARAMTAANRDIRARLKNGELISRQDALKIMSHFLQEVGVDVDSPAFDSERKYIFDFISRHSDQNWADTEIDLPTVKL